MQGQAQTKVHALLDEFTRLMHEDDPARIRSPDPTEYEGEALQVLARFLDERLRTFSVENAVVIVKDVFDVYFKPLRVADTSALAQRLFDAYVSAYDKTQNAPARGQ